MRHVKPYQVLKVCWLILGVTSVFGVMHHKKRAGKLVCKMPLYIMTIACHSKF
ncbi:hypothetical protein D3C73_1384690 [compost metagenome]